MDAIRSVAVDIILELRGAVEEGQVLVVVEAPDAVGARWLQEIIRLNAAHENEVPLEDLVY